MAKIKVGEVLRAEYESAWTRSNGTVDKKMVDFCVNKVTGYVELEDGGYFVFEKPSIETRFCFGYGQNGISTEEDFEDAVAAKQNASTKEYFMSENMKKFSDLEEALVYPGKVYSMAQYRNSGLKLRGIKTDEEERLYGKMFGIVVGEITPVDRLRIKDELANQKKMFEKRLETYWKRFGSTKLKTWTYLVD